ncbi:MAG: hypothetical protein IPJ79_09760 [Bacteroidetes bacterium]|nr:hypothetical protein [Bacteroidota bacterium]
MNLLNNVVNVKPQSKVDVITALLSESYFQQKHLKKLAALHKALPFEEGTQSLRLQIEPYSGDNKFVIELAEFVKYHLNPYLIGCYVHGSLGTYDNNNYSDFDALVILKDNVLTIRKV